MSLWIDDINVSERSATVITPEWVENEVVSYLRQYGFSVNARKSRIYNAQQPALTTGIVLMPDGEHRMPNRLHLKMYKAKQLSKCPVLSDSERERQRQIYISLKHHLKYIRKGSWLSKRMRERSNQSRSGESNAGL
jgi:hypothetical protein